VQSLYKRGTQIRGRKKRRVDALMRLCRARFEDAEEHTARLKSYSIQQASWAVPDAPKLGGIPVLAKRRATSVILRSLPAV
jgi:hypothetical protein